MYVKDDRQLDDPEYCVMLCTTGNTVQSKIQPKVLLSLWVDFFNKKIEHDGTWSRGVDVH